MKLMATGNLSTNCPHCGQPVLVDARMTSQAFQCPKCGGQFSIQSPTVSVVPPVAFSIDNPYSPSRVHDATPSESSGHEGMLVAFGLGSLIVGLASNVAMLTCLLLLPVPALSFFGGMVGCAWSLFEMRGLDRRDKARKKLTTAVFLNIGAMFFSVVAVVLYFAYLMWAI